jgi:hypothetical protein
MFIGAGIGLLFDRVAVGGAIGMGIGFLLMAFIRSKTELLEVKIPSTLSGYFLILLGLAFIIGGFGLIYFPEFLYPYGVGIFTILLGLGFLIFGWKIIIKNRP